MEIINVLELGFDDQSGLSKLYLLERLVNHYGDNCFLQDGYPNEDVGVSVDVSDSTRRFEIGTIDKGIAIDDNAVGPAFIMYSEESTATRFTVHIDNARHLVAVRFNAGQWQYNTNVIWSNFTPVDTDRILAELTLTADLSDTVSALANTDTTLINGIKAGYVNGDLTFIPNFWDGGFNDGEFGVTGTFFEVLI